MFYSINIHVDLEQSQYRARIIDKKNPPLTNGLSHPYHLDQSIFIFRGIGSNFSFLFHFLMKTMSTNRIAPDGMPRFAASHLGLLSLPLSHKK